VLLTGVFNISGDIVVGFVNNEASTHLTFIVQDVGKRIYSRSIKCECFVSCVIHSDFLEYLNAVIGYHFSGADAFNKQMRHCVAPKTALRVLEHMAITLNYKIW